jgi:hypothetical protein
MSIASGLIGLQIKDLLNRNLRILNFGFFLLFMAKNRPLPPPVKVLPTAPRRVVSERSGVWLAHTFFPYRTTDKFNVNG